MIGTALPSIRGRHAALTSHLEMMHRKLKKVCCNWTAGSGIREDQDQEQGREQPNRLPDAAVAPTCPVCQSARRCPSSSHGDEVCSQAPPAVPSSLPLATQSPAFVTPQIEISGTQRRAQTRMFLPEICFPNVSNLQDDRKSNCHHKKAAMITFRPRFRLEATRDHLPAGRFTGQSQSDRPTDSPPLQPSRRG